MFAPSWAGCARQLKPSAQGLDALGVPRVRSARAMVEPAPNGCFRGDLERPGVVEDDRQAPELALSRQNR